MKKNTFDVFSLLFLSAFVGLVLLVYWPGLSGPFLFDDFPNLEPLGYFGGVSDVEGVMRFIFGNGSGPTGRPISMATFLLNDNTWPTSPFSFKFTNLLLHIICGLSALLVLFRVLSDYSGLSKKSVVAISFAVVALWLVHPINISTVLYVVQRMAILSALFSLLSIYSYLLCRDYFIRGRRSSAILAGIAAIAFLIFGVFSKENAVLVVPFVLFLELFWFRAPVIGEKLRRRIIENWYWIVACIVVVVVGSYDWWGGSYPQRTFSIWDRVAYQLPVIGDYILKVLFPIVGNLNLFKGDYEHVRSIDFNYVDLAKLVVFLVLIFLFVFSIKHKNKLMSLGLGWFLIFHSLESSIFPLELYFEHRNYLPSFGLIFFSVVSVRHLGNVFLKSDYLVKFMLGSFFIYLAFCTFILSMAWARGDTLFLKWEMDEPNSARAKVVYASFVESQTFPENALEHIDRAIALEPDVIALQLKKLYLVCRYDLKGDVSRIVESIESSSSFRMGVTAVIKQLIELDENGDGIICDNKNSTVNIEKIFTYAENARALEWNAGRAAQFYSLRSDYFATQGDLDESVKSIKSALGYTPTVDLYLKGAVMLASAGLYPDALEFLEGALEANNNRSRFYPSRIDEIVGLQDRIFRIKSSANR